jgi:hypothetical protein
VQQILLIQTPVLKGSSGNRSFASAFLTKVPFPQDNEEFTAAARAL